MKELLRLAELFKLATIFPNKGEKIVAEVLDVSENDGVRKYVLKFDALGEVRTLFFLDKEED